MMRDVPGTSILIYDQTCAAEKRRRRKRKLMVDPPKRVMINSLVCEGCGDCSLKSACVSVVPKETEFGRKRAIDQSSCNKDYSCVKGFCPSFVSVIDAPVRKRKPSASNINFDDLPAPQFASTLSQPWNILITGVGGTGVVTIGALLGMAAHLESKGASVLDQTGLAQKGGAVTTHVRIAASPSDLNAVRIAAGEADLVLGCDMVVVNDYWSLSKIRADRSHVVLNTNEAMPSSFLKQPDLQFPGAAIVQRIRSTLGDREPLLIDANRLALALMGDAIATNLFTMGYAWQKGLIPISFDAMMRAVELNGAAIEMNKKAFAWGRMAAVDLAKVEAAAGLKAEVSGTVAVLDDSAISENLDQVIARRQSYLRDYQNQSYANRYRVLVDKVRSTEDSVTPGQTALASAVARYAFKLMAYKDEYEVARLYTSGDFEAQLKAQFEDGGKLKFHLAPPLLAKKDAEGHLIKGEYGAWVFTAFRIMKRLKILRGTAMDLFGHTDERKMERRLRDEYLARIEKMLPDLNKANHELAVKIAEVPEHIRGFGHVKEAHVNKAEIELDALMAQWPNPKTEAQAA